MAIRHWLDSNGNWTTAADWTAHVVPRSTDDAVIDAAGSYTVSEDASSTAPIDVHSIEISAGVALAITDVAGNQVGLGGITNKGTLALDGTAALSVSGGFANSGALDLDVGNGDGGGSLTIGGTLANTGAVQVGSGTLSAATVVTLGGLTNATGASVELFGSTAHPATLVFSSGGAGFSENDGTFVLSDTTALSLPDSTFTNKGTLALDGTAALTVTGGFANSGALDLDANSGDGGGSLTIGGTLANTGAVRVGSGTLSAATSLTLGGLTNATGASVELFGSTAHPATLVFSSGGAGFSENDGTFVLSDTTSLSLPDSTFTNKGTLALDGTAALTVTGGFANSGALDLDVGNGDGGGSLTIGGTLANTGAVQVGSGTLSAATVVTLGGLTNATGASVELFGSASHTATLAFTGKGAGFSENDGTFVLSDTTALSLPDSTFTNKGTLALDGTAALTVTGGFANSGALDLDVGNGDGGGSLTIGGTLANTGAVQVGSGTLSAATVVTLGGLTNATGASVELFGSTAHPATLVFSSGGAGFSENDGTFVLSDTTALSLPDSTFTNKGTLALDGTAALTVTGGFANSGALDLDANSGDGGGSLTIGGTLANTGAVRVGSGTLSAATSLTLGGLTNATGASVELFGSTAHPATLVFSSGGAGFSENDGTFVLSDTTSLSLPDSTFTNKGTLALDGTAALTVTGGFANSGALDLDVGNGDGGGTLTIGGTLANTGAVQVGSGTLSAATVVTLGGLTNTTGASVELFGSTAHPATLVFSSGGAGFSENDGTFVLSDTTALSLPDSTFTNKGTLALDGTAALTVTGGFANSGALDLDANSGDGGGSLTIGGTLANTGAVRVGSGTLSAATSLTLGGLTNATGASVELFGSTAHPATLVFSSGGAGFSENDGTFVLSDTTSLSLPDSTFTNKGTLALDGTAALTVTGGFANSGALDLDVGNGDGGGSLTIGGTLANTGAVQVGSGTLSAATVVTLGGLTNATGASVELFGSASHQATVKVIGAAGNSGTIGIGSFAVLDVTGGNSFTQIGGTTTIDGTLTAATIAIDGGVLAVDTTGFTNIGTMIAADGGKIDFSAGGLTNLSGTTLTGGTFTVDAGSTLQLPNNATVVTLAADLTLSGAGSVVQGFDTSSTSSAEIAIESTLTTIAAGGALSVLGGRSYTTANALADSGSLTVGGGSTFTAAALSVTAGGVLMVDAGATLSLGSPLTIAGTATNAGTINGGGPIAVTMASGTGRLILDPTFAFGGTVIGGGNGSVLELAAGRRGTLNALGTKFTNFGRVTVDAGATWTVDALAAALTGARIAGSGGANVLTLISPGVVNLAGVSGFPTINLAAGNSTVTVTDTTLSSGSVTINDGASGNNSISAAGDTAKSTGKTLTYVAGTGTDTFAGGFENDVIEVSAAAVGGDTLTGGRGTNTLDLTTAGTADLAGVSRFGTINLAAGNSTVTVADNTLSGGAVTITDGASGNNSISAAGDTAKSTGKTLTYAAGTGTDSFTGGFENDMITVSAAAVGGDTLTGGSGSSTLELTSAGTVDLSGVGKFGAINLATGDNKVTVADNTLSGGVVTIRAGTGDNNIVNATGDTAASTGRTLRYITASGAGTFIGGLENDVVNASGDGSSSAGETLTFIASSGTDTFTGGFENDVIEVSAAAVGGDTLTGGRGTNTLDLTTAGTADLSGVRKFGAINLAAGNSTVTVADNTLSGGAVTITDGASGNNSISAAGDTAKSTGKTLTYAAGTGTDSFTGGFENDVIEVSAAAAGGDTLTGGRGTSTLILTTAGAVDLSGVGKFATIDLAAGDNTVTVADDTLSGGVVTIAAGAVGNNSISAAGDTAASRGETLIYTTGSGSGAFTGGFENDVVNASGDGSSSAGKTFTFIASSGTARFTGGFENDVVEVGAAAVSGDTLTGGSGTNTLDLTTPGTLDLAGVSGFQTYLLGDGALNKLTLTNGNFSGLSAAVLMVFGGSGGNTLSEAGVAAADEAFLEGGAGADTLIAGQNAVLIGGAGADVFTLTTPGTLASPDTNTIADFTHGTDKVAFSEAGFGLGSSPKAASLFTENATGAFMTPTQRFAYDTTDGTIFFGAHGSASSSRELIATLTGHPTLTASDITFVA